MSVPAGLSAQELTSLHGRVTDTTGAAITGAQVTLTVIGTGAVRSTRSGDDGRFQFVQVWPGEYGVQAAHTGFKTWKQTPVQLLVASPLTLNIVLELGPVEEVVSVDAPTAPALNTLDATRGHALTGDEVRQLPPRGTESVGTPHAATWRRVYGAVGS